MHWIIFASQGWRFTLFLYWKWIEKYVDRHVPWLAKMAINILYKILLSCKWHGPCLNKFVWSNVCISLSEDVSLKWLRNQQKLRGPWFIGFVSQRDDIGLVHFKTDDSDFFYIHLAILRKYTNKFLKVHPRGKAVSVKRLLEIYIHLHVYYVKKIIETDYRYVIWFQM